MKLSIIGIRNKNLTSDKRKKLFLAQANMNEITDVISGRAKGSDNYIEIFTLHSNIPLPELLPYCTIYGYRVSIQCNIHIVHKAKNINFSPVKTIGTYTL
ncbi:MAG: hypothetical protein K2N96_08255 [Muribaculaceae bacterium]|nr:hypothetical protein [Muribaculaceae bacterium]